MPMGVDYVVIGFDMEVQPFVTHNAEKTSGRSLMKLKNSTDPRILTPDIPLLTF